MQIAELQVSTGWPSELSSFQVSLRLACFGKCVFSTVVADLQIWHFGLCFVPTNRQTKPPPGNFHNSSFRRTLRFQASCAFKVLLSFCS